jgi:cysteine desulfurase
LGEACRLALLEREETQRNLAALRDRLEKKVREAIPCIRINGDLEHRLCNTSSISFEFIEGESLLLLLDMNGVAASSGSACTSGSLDPSHVLLALGLRHEVAHGSMRLSIEEDVTDEDIDYILEVVPRVVERLRDMSPVWEKMMKGEKYE